MKLYSIQFGGDRRGSECTMKEVLKGKVVEHYNPKKLHYTRHNDAV